MSNTYPGGKSGAGVYQCIINQIPPHSEYIEPFLGGGGVMRRLRPAARRIGIDLDREALEAFAARFDGPVPELYHCDGIEWLRHRFSLYRLDPGAGSDVARSPGGGLLERPGNPAAAAGACKCRDDAGGVAQSGVQVLAAGSGDARATADPATPDLSAEAFIYCDPPYLLSTRRSQRPLYRYELPEERHVELLQVLLRLPCLVAISGYPSTLYHEALQSWRCIRFQAQTRGGRSATECLWCNYPEPAELHDYRYLGRHKRERERIARKARTWAAGLARLPELERQAVLSAITSRTIGRRQLPTEN